jgi:3-hydroxyacyl-[acyl-carrier-protein] dehydratase
MSQPAQRTERATADVKRIMELLPHRAPMLMIDRLDDIVPGISATGVKSVAVNEPFFAGHFPGHPVMPGVLIVEAMAQTAGALVMYSHALEAKGRLVYFMTIDKARFRHPVVPGDQLMIPVKVQRSRGPVWRFGGSALVNGKLCAEAEFSAMIMEPGGRAADIDE